MPLITIFNTSRSIVIRSADNSADKSAITAESDLPTTAADDYLTPIERCHGAALINRLRQRQQESFEQGIVKARRLCNAGR